MFLGLLLSNMCQIRTDWPQVDLWPWVTLKVSSIYLQCYHDHLCQIWAKTEHFVSLIPSWPLTLDDLKNLIYSECYWDRSCLNTPKEPLAKDLFNKFHHNLSHYVEEFWAYSNNYPKWPLDDLLPKIPEYPYCPLTCWPVTKYHENPSRHIQETFSNCGRTDTQIHASGMP